MTKSSMDYIQLSKKDLEPFFFWESQMKYGILKLDMANLLLSKRFGTHQFKLLTTTLTFLKQGHLNRY